MGRGHFKPEQIIHMLREAEIKLAGVMVRVDPKTSDSGLERSMVG